MRVLITGGCGFIGANLLRRLNGLGGFDVTVVDNEIVGARAAIAACDHRFVRGDIRDAALMARLVEGQDAVVHLAADTGVIPSIEDPRASFDVNVLGAMNVLEAVRRNGRARLISASTGGAILGDVVPPVHEGMAPNPLSPYGASKLMLEGYSSAYAASYGLPITCLRFSNVYGPLSFHKGSVVATFLRRILKGEPVTVYGDGSQTRDYVFVADLVDGIVSAMAREATGVFQLGSGRPVTLNELIAEIEAVVAPREVTVERRDFREGEVKVTWCDIAKARAELGYDAPTQLAEGLRTTWDWLVAEAGAADAPSKSVGAGR